MNLDGLAAADATISNSPDVDDGTRAIAHLVMRTASSLLDGLPREESPPAPQRDAGPTPTDHGGVAFGIRGVARALESLTSRREADEPEPSDRDRREGANDTPDGDDEPGDGAKPRYALLREPERDYGVADLVFAVGAIGKALENHEDDVDVVAGLAGALRIIGAELATASMNVCLRHQQAVKCALDALEQRS
ncbi:MAG TPA: hypothetical protein VIN61_04055 [Gammaproteobacteria bacterium]